MEVLKSIFGGAFLGIAESFPVSGTGHALLIGHILGQDENFRILFLLLHIGILIAVLGAYYKTIFGLILSFLSIIRKIFTGKFSFKELNRSQNMLVMLLVGLAPMFLIFVPVPGSGTNVLGISHEFFDADNVILAGFSFLMNGILLKLGVDSLKSDKFKYTYKTADNVTKRWDGRMKFTVMDALWCGVMQLASIVFPGVSHIGAVFSIGLIRGINRQVSLDYAYLIGISSIVTMLVSEFAFTQRFIILRYNTPAVWLGILCSVIFGFVFIKIFNRMVKKNKMSIFWVYSVFMGLSMIILGIFEQFRGVNLFSGKTL